MTAKKKYKPKVGKAVIAIDNCKGCGGIVYTRSRSLNRAMARFLIALYRHNKNGSWAHCVNLARKSGGDGILASREYQRLVHWKLVERSVVHKADGNPHAGLYRITQLGIDFIEGRVKLTPRIVMRDKKFMGFDHRPGMGRKVSISDVLKVDFDYSRDILDEPRPQARP